MKYNFLMLFVIFAFLVVPFTSFAQNVEPFEGLKAELKACRTIVLENLTKESCQQLILRVKVMEGYIASLFEKSKSAEESNLIGAVQRNLELFRFQCALFEGHTTGVLGSFEMVLRSYMSYRDFRTANGK